MTAFAAEDVTDQPVTMVAAPVVTSVSIDWNYNKVDDNGDIIIAVYIVGYGSYEVCKWDGVNATYIKENLITGTDLVVYAFRQYWNCGPAEAGIYTFTFLSINNANVIGRLTEQVRIEL